MKIRYTILVLGLAFSLANAQVSMEINSGMTVETTGGTSVELSGNLVENGTGYLNGKVESGARSGVTDFAGLTFSASFTGTINRVTGTEYSKGNGEGTNFLRSYELNNTGSAITTNVTSVVASNETNGLTGPLFLYTFDTDWKGNGDGSTGSSVTANSVSIGTGSTDLVISEGTAVAAKIYLEGPYNGTNMNTSLNADVPLLSPYADDQRTAATKPASAVDWVLVQLRETESGATIESRASFINADGFLIEDDGTQGIGIKAKPGDYFIVIKHRNHLGVMTNLIQPGLTWGG